MSVLASTEEAGDGSSSETQGQLVGAGKSLNGREKNSGEQKSRTKIRAPGDKVLTDLFQSKEQFWLLIDAREPLFFSGQSQSSKTKSPFVFPYMTG